MKTKSHLSLALRLLLFFVILHSSWVISHAQVPQLINYQGRVAVGTVNFDGPGLFKFALVDAAGATTYWSNDGSSTAGSQPAAAVSLTVTKGLYSVLLGDTALANMTAIPVSVWTNADVRLRVWFNDGATGFQLLTPDQRLAPNGYLPTGSVTAAKIASGAVGSTQLAANAVQTGNIASGAVGNSQIAAGAVTTSQIASGAVTNAQMAAGSITGANLATQSRSGTLLDGMLNFSTPGSVSVPLVFSPALNASPTMSQSPGGWTLSAVSTAGFTATAPFAPQVIDTTGDVGALTSLAVLASGRPAIAYFDTTNGALKFAVAPNADGSGIWTVAAIGPALDSTKVSLAVIGGFPCVAFRNSSGVAFARASTTDGSGSWTVTTVLAGGTPLHMSLAEVNGRPAIGFTKTNVLNYAIAANPDGSGGWTNLTADNAGSVGQWCSLAVVNGNPAISYRDVTNSRLKYVRANDVAGTTWGTPQTIDSAAPTGTYTSLRVVSGNPAISYFDALNSDLKYIRASDADGVSWSAPVTVDSTGTVGRFTSLAIVNGRPAISYSHTSNGDLKLAYASTADGSGAWTTVALDTAGTVGESTSLAVVNGGPAISYYDVTNGDLKYAAIPALSWAASEFGTTGPIAAASFSGNGAALTSLNGANLTTGSIGSTQLGSNLTLGGTTSGTFSGNGSLLTALNATNLASGTVADALLSANVSRLNAASTSLTGPLGIRTPANPSVALTLKSVNTFQDYGSAITFLKPDGSSSFDVAADVHGFDIAESGVAGARLHLSYGGNVGIGTSTPATKLQVDGTVTATSFSGNGAALTNLNGANLTAGTVGATQLVAGVTAAPVTITGTSQTATANTSYVSTSANPTTLTLPPTANIGDVIQINAAGAGGWSANVYDPTNWQQTASSRKWSGLASSADGRKLVATAGYIYDSVFNSQIYTSTDSGANWTARESARAWFAVASSADGNKLVAVVRGGQIYTSTDSGVTWTPRETARNWQSVASSADGSKLVAVDNYSSGSGGQIYTSADSGVSWMPRESNRRWNAVASSADGVKLVAVDDGGGSGGRIYTSTDSGATWTARESDRNWRAVASSSDGTKLVASETGSIELGGRIYTSTDSGATWTARESNRHWGAVASASDGTKLVAVDIGGRIYTSTDSGLTWAAREENRLWNAVACAADGVKMVAADGSIDGFIYTNVGLTVPQGTSTTLQYTGNGAWSPLTPSQALPAVQLGANVVESQNIAPGAVGYDQLANYSVQGDKIAYGGVQGYHIANGSVQGHHIAPGTITAVNLADGSISAAKLGADVGFWTGNAGDVYRPNGNVGIGTSSPAGKLDVAGNAYLQIPGSSNPIQGLNINVDSFGTGTNAANSWFLRAHDVVGNSDAFIVTGDSKVGIGTGANWPVTTLDVVYRGSQTDHHDLAAYPVNVRGGSQGIAIDVTGGEPDGRPNHTNNYLIMTAGLTPEGAHQIRGSIQGQTADDLHNSFDYIWYQTMSSLQIAYNAAMIIAEGVQGDAGEAAVRAIEFAVIVTEWEKQAIQMEASIGVVFQSNAGDYAEWLEKKNPAEDIKAAEIVGMTGGKISKDTAAAERCMIVSTAPIVAGNMQSKEDETRFKKVAFIGQVPVKVRGGVRVGDYVVASGLNDGYACTYFSYVNTILT